jgi:two-component sensor histidine kinase
VKNNLQVISSILNLQSSYVRDKKTLEILHESQNRIKSMAFVHESLYQTKDFANISFQDYVSNISRNLVASYSAVGSAPELDLDLENIDLNLDTAIPCGLIINELLSNALKYAFPKGKKGKISVSIRKKGKTITVVIADNGVGLSDKIDFKNTESLGLQLVTSLVEQINGKIRLDKKKGTKFTIEFSGTTPNA